MKRANVTWGDRLLEESEKSKELLVEQLNRLQARVSQLEAQYQETEKALIDSKEIYRSITDDVLDSSRVGIMILDSAFRVVWMNRSLTRYTGLRIEQVIGKFKKQLIHRKLKHIFEEPEIYADRVLATYENNTYIEQLECHVLASEDREERWLELWSRPIRSGLYKGGRIEHYTDITNRKRVEAFLRSTKEYSERLINSSTDIIISVDMSRSIIEFNQAAQQAFGYSKDEVIGKHVDILYADPNEGRLIYDKTIQKGNYAKRIANRKKDGTTFEVYLSSSVMYDEDNEPCGLMGVSRYVMSFQRPEEEFLKAAKLESIGVLAGGIAHDFNNLLTSILGSITLVKSCLGTAQNRESVDALEMARKDSQRAQELTRKLLTFAKGGAPVKEVVSASGLLRDIFCSVSYDPVMQRKIAIPDKLHAINVDKEQIRQVIQNLVTNACESMSASGILSVTAKNVVVTKNHGLPLVDGDYVCIRVQDTGSGIPVDQLPKLFDPFYTTKRKNTGLGLATAYSMVRQHDGFVTAESKLGAGATFSIYLKASNAAFQLQTQEQKKTMSGLSKGKVLVLDDEECITAVASKMLKKVGYSVGIANAGEQAVKIFKDAKEDSEPFDVVILDLAVGSGIGGKEVIRIIRKEDPSIKAIVSSGYFDDPIMANYEEYGFDKVVTKPYTFAALTGAVEALMEKKRSTATP